MNEIKSQWRLFVLENTSKLELIPILSTGSVFGLLDSVSVLSFTENLQTCRCVSFSEQLSAWRQLRELIKWNSWKEFLILVEDGSSGSWNSWYESGTALWEAGSRARSKDTGQSTGTSSLINDHCPRAIPGKLKAWKDHRTTQTASQKTAGETVLSIGWILQLAAKVVHCKSCSGEWPEQCKCCPGIKAESDQNGFQVLRERVRSTTEGEVLLNRLLGGEGSALGEMVRWAVSTFLKVKKGFWKSNKFWMDQVSLFKAFESQIVLNKVKWTLNGSGCPTGGWRRCSLGWQLLDLKNFALFLRSTDFLFASFTIEMMEHVKI